MPALKPATATLTVFSFVNNWNDYFSPLIYVTSQAMKTLPLALQTIGGGAAGMSVGRAGAVAALGLRYLAAGRTVHAREHRPDYLRMSQAERERAEKAGAC